MIVIVAIAALLLGFSKAGVAGMLGPLVTVLLALVLPADDAIGLQLPMLIFADTFAIAAYWRRWEASLLPALLLSAVIGIVAGTWILSEISEVGLRRLIGVVVLLFVAAYLVRRRAIDMARRRRWAFAAGSTAGLSSTIAHTGGPPIVMYLIGSGLEPTRFVATAAVFFAIVNLAKVPGYLYADLFDAGLIVSTLWAWLMIPIGVFLGRRLVGRIDRVTFERVMLTLMAVGAVVLLAG